VWIQLAECTYTDRSEQYIKLYKQRYPAGLRPSSGRIPAEHWPVSLTSVSHRYYTFQGSVRHRPELGRCPLKIPRPLVVSDARTPADTRPCSGRRIFRCSYDGAAMRELGESPVKLSSEVKISPSCHRCGLKQQTPQMSGRCPAEFGENRIAGSSEPHRPVIVPLIDLMQTKM